MKNAPAQHFLDLHRKGDPLLLANAWDVGSARLLASLGYQALATTSAGHAGTLGRLDGHVSRDEALAHAAELVGATELPVSADLERGFVDSPEEVAETYRLARETGLAGGSIEDYTGHADDPIYAADLAAARVEAAVEAAHADAGFVLTARCENYLNGLPRLAGMPVAAMPLLRRSRRLRRSPRTRIPPSRWPPSSRLKPTSLPHC